MAYARASPREETSHRDTAVSRSRSQRALLHAEMFLREWMGGRALVNGGTVQGAAAARRCSRLVPETR